jgi:hypothetical protein
MPNEVVPMSRPKIMLWLMLFTLVLTLASHVLIPWVAGAP